MAEELERKYLDVKADDLRPRLEALGATLLYAPHFESNTLYDSPDGSLTAKRELLRLRTREWADHKESLLTFKIPLPDVLVGSGPVKRREETELAVEDAEGMARIFGYLGYFPRAVYEKVRESWTFEGAHIDMDTLPFMHCVEVEAKADLLQTLEERLGLDDSHASAQSYHIIHREWLAAHGMPHQEGFRFPPGRRLEIRRKLGVD